MKDWSNYSCQGQMTIFDFIQDPTCGVGKTSQAHSPAIKERTSDKSLKKLPKSYKPMFLYLYRGGGRWSNAGFVDGDGYSIAWCIRNAVNEGVPQRRRRIFLVADFRGRCAAEILFKREGVCWDFETIRKTWETTSRSLEERIDEARQYIRTGISHVADGDELKNA